jgi:hypothetical protein
MSSREPAVTARNPEGTALSCQSGSDRPKFGTRQRVSLQIEIGITDAGCKRVRDDNTYLLGHCWLCS